MSSSTGREYVLTVRCPDRPGLVHAVSGFLVDQGVNITESQQFSDPVTRQFFLRTQFEEISRPLTVDQLTRDFGPRAEQFSLDFRIRAAQAPCRTIVLVSRQLHCLNDLLFRQSTGALRIEIPVVVSNHPDAARLAEAHGVRFDHVPVTPSTREHAEQRLLELMAEHRADLVVLARYMQVLPDGLCAELSGRAINIHHSFLPSFKGARPYHQAYDRGVKLIGATAHYVTPALDEGPIIEQDVVRVDHSLAQDRLVAAGRDVEAQVLARAVRWHAESRVLINGERTVVFA